MRTLKLAKLGIERAERWLRSAEVAMEDKRYDDVVYSSQMCVELAAKSILLAFGLEYPREHDVGEPFLKLGQIKEIQAWFKHKVDSLAKYISILAEKRGLAGYGFEEGMDVSYFKDFANEAFGMARQVFEACRKLLKELTLCEKKELSL
jgi:HEPN domain-containing protein